MTENLITPDRAISIAGKPYTLLGNFGTLKALQHAFDKDIIEIQGGVRAMRQDEVARLIAVSLQASVSTPPTEDEIGQWLIEELDITSIEYLQLKIDLMFWLSLALTPKREREKKRAEIEEILSKAKKITDSLGTTTSGSPPASSAGL